MDQIITMKVPEKVIIPMEQYLGLKCEPLVGIGDKVKAGQKIGECKEVVAPIHSSISGEVVDILMHPHPYGREVKSIIIEGDGKSEKIEYKPQEKPTPKELLNIIRKAGIIESYGLGPLARPEKIDTVILNGTDFHPHITVDKALMIQEPRQIIKGRNVLMKAGGAQRGYICINAGDKDTTKIMKDVVKIEPRINLIPLKMVYARGMGKLLIYAVARRSHTVLGKVLISTVPKAKGIYDAVFEGRPNIEALVSVTGVQKPMNLLVRIGTPFKDVIEYCGGYVGTPTRIIMNSPMTGLAQYTDQVPVIKETYGIMVQHDTEIEKPIHCIRCAKCVDVCPVNLVPSIIAIYAENNRFQECRKYHIFACVECGYCAYECPSRIPILQLIRYAKANLKKEGET